MVAAKPGPAAHLEDRAAELVPEHGLASDGRAPGQLFRGAPAGSCVDQGRARDRGRPAGARSQAAGCGFVRVARLRAAWRAATALAAGAETRLGCSSHTMG